METQFPVSKMSKESYAEREAKQSQTLTGLGKWWGRKPLVLCRATILGLLLPATDNPEKDRNVFLRLMTMDDDGMLRRKSKRLPAALVAERVPPAARERHFVMAKDRKGQDAIDYRPSATATRQRELYRKAFRKNPKAGAKIDAAAVFAASSSADRAAWFTHDSTDARAEFYVCPENGTGKRGVSQPLLRPTAAVLLPARADRRPVAGVVGRDQRPPWHVGRFAGGSGEGTRPATLRPYAAGRRFVLWRGLDPFRGRTHRLRGLRQRSESGGRAADLGLAQYRGRRRRGSRGGAPGAAPGL